MALMTPPKVGTGGGGTYEESIEEQDGWKLVRRHIRDSRVPVDGTFKVKGVIKKFITAEDGTIFFVSERKDERSGQAKMWVAVKVVAALTDQRFVPANSPGLELPPKTVGASFFDGYTSKDKPRSPLRGGMYNVHLAVTHHEPDKDQVRYGAFDPDDYIGKPILLDVVYKGKVEEDSPYYGRRGNLTLFVNGFERDPDSPNFVSDLDDDDEEV